MTTKKEKEHYDRLARFGCVLCSHLGIKGTPAEIHHVRRFGIPRRLAPVIPLCPEHHRGNSGLHGLGAKEFEKYWKVSQEDLLTLTNIKLEDQNGSGTHTHRESDY